MKTILDSAPTEKLSETYEKFVGRVLRDAAEQVASDKTTITEKEHADSSTSVLAENVDQNVEDGKEKLVLATGDVLPKKTINESEVKKLDPEVEAEIRRLKIMVGSNY